MARNSEKAIAGGKKIDEDPYFYGDDYISDSGDEMYIYNDDSGDEDFVVDKGESKEQLVDESDGEAEEHYDDDYDDEDFLDFDKNKMQKKKTNNKDKSIKPIEENLPGHLVHLDHNYALVATSIAVNPEHCYVKTVTRTVTPGKRKRKGPIEVRTEYLNDQEYLGTFEKSPEKKILGKCPRRKSKGNVYPRLEDVKCLVIGGVEKVHKTRKRYNSTQAGSFTGVDEKGSGTKTILLGPANIKSSESQKITILYPENMKTQNSQSVIDTEKLAKKINFPKVIIKHKSELETIKSDDKGSNSVLKSEIKVEPTETSLISGDTNSQKIIASPSFKLEKTENSPSPSVRSILVMKRKGQSHVSVVHNSVVREELDGDKQVTSLPSKVVVDETKPVIPEGADDDEVADNDEIADDDVDDFDDDDDDDDDFDDDDDDDDDDDVKERDKFKTRKMTREEKVAIIEEATNLGHNKVCKKYKIPSRTLSNWKKRFRPNQNLQECNSNDFEEKILSAVLKEWDTSLYYPQHDVKDVVRRALHCVESSFIPDNTWQTNFCDRHKQILTMCDPLSKLLPGELEQSLKAFYENHKKNRIKNRIGDNNIICMDELPLEFFSGEGNNVGALKYDGRNPHCILLLSCCSNGSMLPPMVVFKDQKLTDVSIPDKWKVLSTKDGNINAEILCQWIQDILEPFTKKNKYKYTLIWDEFIPHKEERVKQALQASSIVPVFIPAGCSTKVQALEMGIKQSIRTSIHQQWCKLVSDWKPKSPRLGTRSSSRTLWSVEDILLWIDTALAQIEDQNVIKQAFLTAGIANSLDRRHDYYIRSDRQIKIIMNSLGLKKKTTLARWRAAHLGDGVKEQERRPYLASDCDDLRKAEKFRRQIIGEVSRKVAQIQNAGLGEFKLRDLNDEINKLLREKGHWEDRIKELNGPDYRKIGPKMLDHEGKEVPGNRGYKYFGAAKDLPGVRELFEQEPPPQQRKTRAEMMKDIDADYYGYRDEDDGLIVPIEMEEEKKAIATAVREWKERQEAIARGEIPPDNNNEGEQEEDVPLYRSEEVEEEEMDTMKPEDENQHFIAHVPVPSQKEIEEALVQRKKMELLQQYASDSLQAEADQSKQLLGL